MTSTSDHTKPLFFVPRYWPSTGGAELHTRELATHLVRRGPVGVIRHVSSESQAAEVAFAHAPTCTVDDDGIPVYQLGPSGPLAPLLRRLSTWHAKARWSRPLYAEIYKVMMKAHVMRLAQSYQLMHAVYNGFTPSAQLAAQVCRKLSMPFVWTPLAHTTLAPGTGWSSPAFRRLYARADALITMTAYERDWLIQQGALAERVHVCPVAVLLDDDPQPEAFRSAYGIGLAPLILFLGRLVDYKGYRQLCEAADDIWQQVPDARFVFIGPPTEESENWFKLHDDPRFMVTGLISEQDKTSALAACDILCVPSTQESLGVAYLEAWTFEKPVIAADIPVLRTVIEDGVDGLLVRPEGKQVAEAILHLLQHPERSQAMGRRGASKVQATYNWSNLADRMAAIHRTVVELHARGHDIDN